MRSSTYRPGRLSHLEEPVHQIQRYLAGRIRSTDPLAES